MTDHDVPEYAQAALRRVTDEVDELRTQRIRFRAAAEAATAELSTQPHTDPAETLRQAALDRDAPIGLVRLARAVQEGRTSWQEIVTGQAESVPEVVALRAHANEEIARLVDSGALRHVGPPEQDAPPPDGAADEPRPPRRAPRRPARDEETGEEDTFQSVYR